MAQSILAQWFDPRFEQARLNKQLFQLSLTVDSLEADLDRKNEFITNFQSIVSGEIDESDGNSAEANTDTSDKDVKGLTPVQPIDSVFRAQFENSEFENVSFLDSESDLQEIFFFSPISGLVINPFEPNEGHYGVDVAAKKNEPIECVADGTVIFADFDFSDSGYVIAVQHRNNVISIYKHNSAILKKVTNCSGSTGLPLYQSSKCR
jgi:murein DD-endopeptidase MepM/ murein hydrolase activator NlpD